MSGAGGRSRTTTPTTALRRSQSERFRTGEHSELLWNATEPDDPDGPSRRVNDVADGRRQFSTLDPEERSAAHDPIGARMRERISEGRFGCDHSS